MFNLLEKMYVKRYCLSSDTNMNDYENGNNKIQSCFCGNYNHIACVLQGKQNILNFAENITGDIEGNTPGIHAEHNALLKLKPLNKKKRLTQINLLVIRVSKTNKIQSSKPCWNCILNMKSIPEKKGYKLKLIYYSDGNGNIIKTTLNKLQNEDKHYSKFYRKRILAK